jgi:AcrR family transcriptional regulator
MMSEKAPVTKLTRRQRNRERTMGTILETSRAIMREQGVAALSMHELARRMGMRAPSLYNYFDGLMDLYDAVFRQGMVIFGTHIQAYTQGAPTWQEAVRLAMEAYLSFAVEFPELYQLCFERPVPGFAPSEESMRVSLENLQTAYQHVADLKDNLDSTLPAEQIADLVISLMHGLTALHMANEPHLPVGQGRFGSLIPAAVSVLDQAWSKV